MRQILIIEDTPQGIHTTARWEHNGVCDSPDQSVSLVVLGGLVFNLLQEHLSGRLRVTGDALSLLPVNQKGRPQRGS